MLYLILQVLFNRKARLQLKRTECSWWKHETQRTRSHEPAHNASWCDKMQRD